MFEDIFQNKRADYKKLLQNGFAQNGETYSKSYLIMEDRFRLDISFDKESQLHDFVTDLETLDPYIVYKTNARGEFVNRVREEIRLILKEVASTCFIASPYKSEQTLRILKIAKQLYEDELEFLWDKFPDISIIRRKDTLKWYAAFMRVSASKLGMGIEGEIEILNVRINPLNKDEILAKPGYFPAYHMNKKSWISLDLNGSIPDEEIVSRVKESHALAKGK